MTPDCNCWATMEASVHAPDCPLVDLRKVLSRIVDLHEIEIAQRHKPIEWWRERFGTDGWVAASTKARRDLDASIREAKGLLS